MFKYLDQIQKLQLASPFGPSGELQDSDELFASTLLPIVAKKPYSLAEQCIRTILPNPSIFRTFDENLPLDLKQRILDVACDLKKVVPQLYEVFYDPAIKRVDLSNIKCVNQCISEMIKKIDASNHRCGLEVLLVSWTAVDPLLICNVIRSVYHPLTIKLINLGLPNLKAFHCWKSMQIDDSVLISISQHCPDLLSLDLRACAKITNASIDMISQHCCKLRKLLINSCPSITRIGQFPELYFLGLAGSNVKNVPISINLRSLNVSMCDINSETLLEIGLNCAELTSLNLKKCKDITFVAIETIVKNGKIKSLNLSETNVNDEILQVVALNCPQLTSLNLSGCIKITDISCIIKNCQSLKILELQNCVNIQELKSEYISKELRVLDIGGCDINKKELLDLSNCVELRTILLSQIESVDDNVVQQFTLKCPKLQHFDLTNCNTSDVALYAIAENSLFIETLSIASGHVTIKGIESILSKKSIWTFDTYCVCWTDHRTLWNKYKAFYRFRITTIDYVGVVMDRHGDEFREEDDKFMAEETKERCYDPRELVKRIAEVDEGVSRESALMVDKYEKVLTKLGHEQQEILHLLLCYLLDYIEILCKNKRKDINSVLYLPTGLREDVENHFLSNIPSTVGYLRSLKWSTKGNIEFLKVNTIQIS